MAESKIQLTLGGNYTAGAAFRQANDDVKKLQNANRDMADAARKTVGSIAGAFEGELNGVLRTTGGLLNEIARGGLWGALASVANIAIGYLVDRFKEAKAAAVEFSEICRNGVMEAIGGIEGRFSSLSKKMQEANATAKDMLDVMNGKTAANAELKVHQLHISTLQKMTDGMTSAAKGVILADEAYQAAVIRGTAAIEQAAASTEAAQADAKAATDRRLAAESSLAAISEERANLEAMMADNGRGWLAKRTEIEANLAKNEEMFSSGIIDLSKYLKYRKDLQIQLSKLESEHADELTQLNEAKKSEERAAALVAEAKRAEEAASRAVTKAQQKEEVARSAAAVAEADAAAKLDAANLAVTKEAEAAEAAARAADEKAYHDATIAHITAICAKRQVDAAGYLELYATCMANGATEAEAYAELQKKLNDELKRRSEAEAKANEDVKNGKKSNASTATTTVNINPSQVGQGVAEWDGKTTWHNTREKMSQDIREANQERKRMNQELAPYINLLKGNYPETMAKEYMEKLKQDYSMSQLQEMTQKALRRQLLSTSEQKEQLETLKKMLTAMEQQGLK